MKLFSFFKPLSKFFRQLGRDIWLGWLADQFNLFPSERSLLVSFWHSFTYYKFLRPSGTVYLFLDLRVVEFQNKLADEKVSAYKKQLIGELLKALHNQRVRPDIVAFLESPNPEENYPALWSKIRSAWRLPVEEPPITPSRDTLSGPNEVEILSKVEPVAGPEHNDKNENDPCQQLNAKTYIIAADIYFELGGRQAEFKKLSQQIPELIKFVQENFGMSQVPGTFRKLKGYSYMKILNGGSYSQLGQLKPHFRQIIDHPEIFGEAIAKKARKIFDEYFI